MSARAVLESLLHTACVRMGRADLVVDDHGDEGDVARGHELRALTGATRARAAEQARLCAAAIARMDAGTYGLCTECDEPIAAKRLAYAPEVERCIPCQETADRLIAREGAMATAWEADEE